MKRFVVLLLCIIMTLVAAVTSFAEISEGSELTIDLMKYYRYETEQITMAVKDQYTAWEKYMGNNPDDIYFTLMYQVYYLKMKDIVSAYETDGNFVSNITDKYYWVVPNYNKGSEVQVVRNDDTEYGWAIRRGTRYMNSIDFSYKGVVFGIAAIYDNILEKKPDVDKDSFRLVYDELNDMHIMYFTSEGEEYVVPYFASKDITWLTNEEVYTASEYVELMKSHIVDETSHMKITDGNPKPETIYFYYLIIGTVMVIAIALVAFIIAKRKNKKS
ncbi:MAG: hypothetical protein IJA55_09865 [Clostridia bacterium]|nr:hypothetical protein [Clostridia bacterium]